MSQKLARYAHEQTVSQADTCGVYNAEILIMQKIINNSLYNLIAEFNY